MPPFTDDYPDVVDRLPENFDDDLLTKPACHRQWRWDQQHWLAGYLPPEDEGQWRRQLDYYVKLHQLADDSLGTVLAALERSGAWDDTVVVFTSDHGDMCGSHGLRSKGPVRLRRDHAGAVLREAGRLVARRRVGGAAQRGAVVARRPGPHDLRVRRGRAGSRHAGRRPRPAASPTRPRTVRDHVLFAHATAHTSNIRATRWAIRGIFDGRHKYARYYGVGGGLPNDDFTGVPTPMLYGPDAAFEDQEHEWYDQQEDPHELVNLAMDNGRRTELRERFADLLAIEAKELIA